MRRVPIRRKRGGREEALAGRLNLPKQFLPSIFAIDCSPSAEMCAVAVVAAAVAVLRRRHFHCSPNEKG